MSKNGSDDNEPPSYADDKEKINEWEKYLPKSIARSPLYSDEALRIWLAGIFRFIILLYLMAVIGISFYALYLWITGQPVAPANRSLYHLVNLFYSNAHIIISIALLIAIYYWPKYKNVIFKIYRFFVLLFGAR